MVWTRFMDMCSGGSRKEAFSKLYIEAPEEEAKAIFYNRFGHNPERVSCTCCGRDYSIDEEPTLAKVTAGDRGCRWAESGYVEEGDPTRKYQTYVPLDRYLADGIDVNGSFGGETIAVIYASEIEPKERSGRIPEQGYVWVD